MAFTNTTLSITPLLETTFISDMRIIVNSNVTVLKSKIEDVINELQIDLVNKYIGTDTPLGLVRTNNLVVANQLLFKDGPSVGATTIAELRQSAGTSTFSAHHIEYTNTIRSTAATSRAALKTVVIGGTSGGSDLLYPTTSGNTVPGLYVGDSTNPVAANFYGNVGFTNTAITQSSNYAAVRELQATRNAGTYSYTSLKLSRTDPQFLVVNIKMPDTSQANDKPIWIQLHEVFTTADSRPQVGQSFTIIFNDILGSNSQSVATSNWPLMQAIGSTDAAIGIMPGYIKDSTPGNNKYKACYINGFEWNTWPTSETQAVTYLSSQSTDKNWIRLFVPSVQTDQTGPGKLGACVTITKVAQETDYSRYIITSGSNYTIVNS
jgi:hypothetical protein